MRIEAGDFGDHSRPAASAIAIRRRRAAIRANGTSEQSLLEYDGGPS
ncbi:MAG: hypothetical protein OJF58_000805 [Enhydrobacter sp.]|nr:MAG: hypothetical protein OJF58_000805 [Enhydrobacter sp.]